MEIDPDLKAAVRERVQLGHESHAILQELREAGYSFEEAQAVYTAVASERGVRNGEAGASAVPPATPPTTSKPAAASTPGNTSSFFTRHPSLAVGSIVLLLTIGGTVAASAWFDLSGWRNYVPFLSSAPYDEMTLLPGIINDLSESTAVEVDSRFRAAWEPRTPDAKEAFPEMFSSIESLSAFIGELPDDAYINSQALTQVDARNPDDIRSHVEVSVDAEVDIIQLAMAGSLRQIDTTFYGRIDELPAMMTAELGDVPMNTWIELFDEATLKQLESGQGLPAVPGVSWLPFLDKSTMSQATQPTWWASLQEVWSSVAPESQAALVAPLENVPSGGSGAESMASPFDHLDEETRRAVRDAVTEAWSAAPAVSLARSPERMQVDEEVVYQYDLQIEAENLDTFFATLRTELAEYPELVQDLPTRAELPDSEAVAQFSRLVDVLVTVRPDGSLHGFSVSSVLTSPNQSFAHQINLALTARYAPLGDDVNITVPDEIYPQTLLEMIEAEQRAAQEAMLRQQASSLRSTAEIYYNDNNLSYAGFCEEVSDRAVFWSVEPQCAAATNAYAVQLPRTAMDAFCIDSTGFAGDVPVANWSTTTPSYACSNE